MSTTTADVKMITEAQASYIRSLIEEVRPELPVDEEGLALLTRAGASIQITALLAKRDEIRLAAAQAAAEKAEAEQAHEELVAEAPAAEFALPEGYFTVVMEGAGHRTFRVKTVKNGGLAGRRIISYLMGSDNTSDYQGFGFVDALGVQIWKRFSGESLMAYAVDVLLGNVEQAQLDYALESGNCYVCGRMLTDPRSIELGIGPVCRGEA